MILWELKEPTSSYTDPIGEGVLQGPQIAYPKTHRNNKSQAPQKLNEDGVYTMYNQLSNTLTRHTKLTQNQSTLTS